MGRHLDEETVDKIYELNQMGLYIQDIAEYIGININSVKYRLKKVGLKGLSKQTDRIIRIDEESIQCKECHIIKKNSGFSRYKDKGGKYLYQGICHVCTGNKKNDKIYSSIESKIFNIFSSSKRKCAIEKIDFDLTYEFLIELYNKQGGKCFYTNEEFIFSKKHRYTISLDRVRPKLGYTKNNVVFCLYKINLIKNDMEMDEIKKWFPLWYVKLVEFFGTMDEYFKVCHSNNQIYLIEKEIRNNLEKLYNIDDEVDDFGDIRKKNLVR